MKKYHLTWILLILTSSIFAQNPNLKGQSQLNAGIGLSSWGVPIYLGLDYGVNKDITIGGEISYRSYNEDWSNNEYKHTVIGISGNANYHFNSLLNIPSKWDFYAGLNIGFFNWSSPDGYAGSHTSGISLGAQVGGRYYFSNKFGINFEFGGGNAFSGGKFGISLKL